MLVSVANRVYLLLRVYRSYHTQVLATEDQNLLAYHCETNEFCASTHISNLLLLLHCVNQRQIVWAKVIMSKCRILHKNKVFSFCKPNILQVGSLLNVKLCFYVILLFLLHFKPETTFHAWWTNFFSVLCNLINWAFTLHIFLLSLCINIVQTLVVIQPSFRINLLRLSEFLFIQQLIRFNFFFTNL